MDFKEYCITKVPIDFEQIINCSPDPEEIIECLEYLYNHDIILERCFRADYYSFHFVGIACAYPIAPNEPFYHNRALVDPDCGYEKVHKAVIDYVKTKSDGWKILHINNDFFYYSIRESLGVGLE